MPIAGSWSAHLGRGWLALLPSLVLVACGGGAGFDPPKEEPSGADAPKTSQPASGGAAAACIDGATQECSINVSVHGDVKTCTSGVATCSGGVFGACEPLSDDNAAAPVTFLAVCDPNRVAHWSRVAWTADAVSRGRLVVTAQALPAPESAVADAAPVDVVDIQAGGDPASCNGQDCTKDIAALLGDAAGALPRLKLSTRFEGSHASGAPGFKRVTAYYDCVAK